MGYQQFMENSNSMEKGFNPKVENLEKKQSDLIKKHHEYSSKLSETTDEKERAVIQRFIEDVDDQLAEIDRTYEKGSLAA